MPKNLWNLSYINRAYELAKTGMTNSTIAKTLGISIGTFKVWQEDKPEFKEAIEKGRGASRTLMEQSTFAEYVFNRLPAHLRDLWKEIHACEEEENGIERIEKLLACCGKKTKQHLFLYAIVHTNFNASAALRLINVPRKSFESWLHKDPDFAELMDEIHWHKKNFFEEALVRLVKRGDPGAIIFVNKTYNRDRGYTDKLDVSITGQVNHLHAAVKVDELNLPLEQRKTLLEAVRKQKQLQELKDAKDE